MHSQPIEVVLVRPFSSDLEGVSETTNTLPLGIAYLAGTLESHGFTPHIIDACVSRTGPEETAKQIAILNPKIVGISANIFTGKAGIIISRELRNTFDCKSKIFFGGAFPTSNPQKFLVEGLADAVVIGEGEVSFLRIVQEILEKGDTDLKDLLGIAYLDQGGIVFGPPSTVIRDLDSLSFPAWHLLPDLNLYETRARKTPAAAVLTSRGCPFNCNFCSKDVFKSLFRPRSPMNVIAEVDHLVKEFGVKQLDVMDDNFSLNRKRTMEILDLLIERDYNLSINLQLGVRIDSIDEEVINKMKEAGVFKIAFGIESGDPRVLKNIKKDIDLEQALKATAWSKKAGMIVYGFFMFGLPGDTPESMQRTIDFAKKMNPTIANFVITIPFPGTELYRKVQDEGKFLIDPIDGLNVGFYGQSVFYEIGNTKKEDVLKFYRKAYRSFYYRPTKIIELIFSSKSLSELKWVLKTGFFVLSSLFRKSLRT